jgi:(S)-ureidoglycine aminohydrolase
MEFISSPLYGHTRTRVGARHALLAPESLVPSTLPGVTGATVHVVVSPEIGARFAQILLAFAKGEGVARFPGSELEHFVFVTDGGLCVEAMGRQRQLAAGGFAFVPPHVGCVMTPTAPETRCVLFQKPYAPFDDGVGPEWVSGTIDEIPCQPFLGDPAAMLQAMLPDRPAYDMAVNLFTYQPGAALPLVESHIMEHGLLMLRGQGIYRLEDSWYPVRKGDVIWMASYCPQWFGALGKEPAAYIYYKDVYRRPISRLA